MRPVARKRRHSISQLQLQHLWYISVSPVISAVTSRVIPTAESICCGSVSDSFVRAWSNYIVS